MIIKKKILAVALSSLFLGLAMVSANAKSGAALRWISHLWKNAPNLYEIGKRPDQFPHNYSNIDLPDLPSLCTDNAETTEGVGCFGLLHGGENSDRLLYFCKDNEETAEDLHCLPTKRLPEEQTDILLLSDPQTFNHEEFMLSPIPIQWQETNVPEELIKKLRNAGSMTPEGLVQKQEPNQ